MVRRGRFIAIGNHVSAACSVWEHTIRSVSFQLNGNDASGALLPTITSGALTLRDK